MKNKTTLRVIAFAFAALLANLAAAAGGSSNPSGVWKALLQVKEREVPSTVRLKYEDGKLTGFVPIRSPYDETEKDFAISDGAFKDGIVSFAVKVPLLDGVNENEPFVVKYRGKLDNDKISGTIEFIGTQNVVIDWNPRREGGSPNKTTK